MTSRFVAFRRFVGHASPGLSRQRARTHVGRMRTVVGAGMRKAMGRTSALGAGGSALLSDASIAMPIDPESLLATIRVMVRLAAAHPAAREQYRLKATVKKKKMFAAARELAEKHQYAGFAAASAWVMTCQGCGADLCVDCAAPAELRLRRMVRCVHCGGLASPILVPPDRTPFWRLFPAFGRAIACWFRPARTTTRSRLVC